MTAYAVIKGFFYGADVELVGSYLYRAEAEFKANELNENTASDGFKAHVVEVTA